MPVSMIVIIVIFPAAMAFAAASDLLTMTISNKLSLILIAAFVVCAFAVPLSLSQIGLHFAAGGLVLAICFGMFAAGWIGGGDAKLAAATALWFGFGQLLPYLLIASVFGGVMTLVILKLRGHPLPIVAENWGWLRRLHAANSGVPYGIALAFSALLVLPDTEIWRAGIGL
ncbi:A24 family peptidase [Bosea sp. PAMC 26642]|uniref:A24 family peptidase n=1 Tax=Bosea sp. (strain PAMC 26642) TaxID=1792307 RepID=UPI0007703485|nr:prepilin peptidase [Bosea sp. PAMC 26642]AMJ62332.1 peptidase [Bosea sp. PAMC 26642]